MAVAGRTHASGWKCGVRVQCACARYCAFFHVESVIIVEGFRFLFKDSTSISFSLQLFST
eukprot:gene10975-3046_t